MSKKNYRMIFTIIVVLIIISLVVFYWRIIFPPKDEAQKELEDSAGDNSIQTLPAGTFPLYVTDKNQKVKAMQEALIKLGASIPAGPTGYFGTQTQAALKFAGYNDSKIEQADYNDILAGKKKI